MNIRIQKTLRWTATLFGLFGITFFIAVLIIPEKTFLYLLEATECAISVSIIALLIEVLVKKLGVEQSFGDMLLAPDLSDDQTEYSPVSEEFAHRQALLNQRLQIDEPRICSKRNIPCTCWSFCGGDPDMKFDSRKDETVPLNFLNTSNEKSEPNEESLPIIDRSKVTDCPFP
jgi:hypothetical protein